MSNIIEFPLPALRTHTGAEPISAAVLRSRLILARERVLVPNFDQVPRDRGLLRRRMLDELVHHRPTTRSEFFRCIPPDLLRNTDPIQFDAGLEFVLGLIWGDPRLS